MASVYFVDGNGDVVQREVSFEIGEDEAYKKGLYGVSSAWDVNLKGVTDAWQNEWLRGSRELDEFNQMLKAQVVRQQEEMHDGRQRFQEKLDSIFANSLQNSLERMGVKQDVGAQNMQFNAQDVAGDAISAGLANQSQTQGAIASAISADVAESLRAELHAFYKLLVDAVK